MPVTPPTAEDLAHHWTLDPHITFLNHGSFGACPRPVLEAQSQLRARIEREPVKFFVRRYDALLEQAREKLAAFLGAPAEGLAFVPNATTGVNTVLNSLRLEPGDELLVTDHEYNACHNALDAAAERAGARVVKARVPFPLSSPEEIEEAILGCVTPRTRLALIDHITSQTGLIFPIARLVQELQGRDVDVLVDGAHAPGMVPLNLAALGAAYYTGNCHKWLCAPKGAAFLHVRQDRLDSIRPLTISHGANFPLDRGRTRFRLEFDWTGTHDPTPFLCVPVAIDFMGSLLPGGWPEVMARNHALVLAGREHLCQALDQPSPPCPEEMVGSIASLVLPRGSGAIPDSPLYTDPLQDALLSERGIEVPIIPWPAPPLRLIRISAQLYNHEDQYRDLAAALSAGLD